MVIYPAHSNRRSHNNDDATKQTDDNIDDREDDLRCSKINFATKIDLKIRCTLEMEMKKLFELKKKKLRP